MPRFDQRPLTEIDFLRRWDIKKSDPDLIRHDILAAICRLKDDGSRYFHGDATEQQKARDKWNTECQKLWDIIIAVRTPIQGVNEIRDFISTFDHTQWRIHELLYSSEIEESQRKACIESAYFWFNAIYRFSTYFILSRKNMVV